MYGNLDRTAWIGALCLMVAPELLLAEVPGSSPPLAAIATRVENEVWVVTASPSGVGTSERPLRSPQTVPEGASLRLAEGAGAGLVCSTERWVEIEGSRHWRLTATACAEGRPLPAGTYAAVRPRAGRLRSVRGALAIELESRAPPPEADGVPIVWSPRNTALLDPRPVLRWTSVPGAVEYQIEFSGGPSFTVRVAAGDLDCLAASTGGKTRFICSLPWPEPRRPLAPGRRYALAVGARLRPDESPRRSHARHRLELLRTEESAAITQRLRILDDLPVDPATRLLLRAALFADAELNADAIDAYSAYLECHPSPPVANTLGDLYRRVGLYGPAAESYRQVLTPGTPLTDRAAARLGLGLIHFATRRYHDAAVEADTAIAGYRELDLPEETAAAAELAAAAHRRLP